jgi:hypothetical protein
MRAGAQTVSGQQNKLSTNQYLPAFAGSQMDGSNKARRNKALKAEYRITRQPFF